MKEQFFVFGVIISFIGGVLLLISVAPEQVSTLKLINGEYDVWSTSAYIDVGTTIVVDFRPRNRPDSRWVFEPPPIPDTNQPYSWKRIEVIVLSPSGKNTSFWVTIVRDPNDIRRVGVFNISLENNGGALEISKPIYEIKGVTTETGNYTVKIGLMWPPEPPEKLPTWIGISKEKIEMRYPYFSYLPIALIILVSGTGMLVYYWVSPRVGRKRSVKYSR